MLLVIHWVCSLTNYINNFFQHAINVFSAKTILRRLEIQVVTIRPFFYDLHQAITTEENFCVLTRLGYQTSHFNIFIFSFVLIFCFIKLQVFT